MFMSVPQELMIFFFYFHSVSFACGLDLFRNINCSFLFFKISIFFSSTFFWKKSLFVRLTIIQTEQYNDFDLGVAVGSILDESFDSKFHKSFCLRSRCFACRINWAFTLINARQDLQSDSKRYFLKNNMQMKNSSLSNIIHQYVPKSDCKI